MKARRRPSPALAAGSAMDQLPFFISNSSAVRKPSLFASRFAKPVLSSLCAVQYSSFDTLPSLLVSRLATPHLPSAIDLSAIFWSCFAPHEPSANAAPLSRKLPTSVAPRTSGDLILLDMGI